ncbi:fimbrial biogenesis chaperone [Marinimicrobium sp. C2-29]|uniref:fimbrial biogenesis chaperone n=1 Tax=Marinimicrobium sp. C2-29 TaxID=3139825 RepID=UPI00313937AF
MKVYSYLLHFVRYLLAGGLLLTLATPVVAELMLFPTRVVFEENERAAKVELMNTGASNATYRISLVNQRMSETGAFSKIDEPRPGEQFADQLLRYSPRQVTLLPGKGQTVRLMVRKPAGLEDGEYRSHLLFSRVPDAKPPTPNLEEEEISIRVRTLVSVSIPVIVRQGNTSAEVTLTDLNLLDDAAEPMLKFAIKRTGNQSVYGDLSVTFVPRNGEPEVVARANGVAVYTPNAVRRASIPLNLKQATVLAGGTLKLQYREQAKDGGDLMATTSLTLP